MKATERHHLKQNEFLVTTARVVDAFERNRSRALLIAGVALLALIVIGGSLFWRNQQANRAGALLGAAMATAESQIAPAPSLPGATPVTGTFPTEEARAEAVIAAYNEVIAQYPATDAARVARYHLAGELLDAGRLDEAEQQFRQVAEDAGSTLYGPLARLGVAQAQGAAGKTDEAIATLTELAASRDGLLPVDGVLMELGRISLKAGRTEDARAAFRRVVDEFPDSTYALETQQQLTALE
jgi:predicted negative regulator of RcsB-dependent stress response